VWLMALTGVVCSLLATALGIRGCHLFAGFTRVSYSGSGDFGVFNARGVLGGMQG